MSEAAPSPGPASDAPTQGTPSPDGSSATEVPSVHSWAFWKKRLARLLVLGALVLGATQVLPTLPEDQSVEVRSSGAPLRAVHLTYYDKGDTEGDPLVGTQITLAEPGKYVPHSLRLKNGDYTVVVEATLETADGKTRLVRTERSVTLSGRKALISLD